MRHTIRTRFQHGNSKWPFHKPWVFLVVLAVISLAVVIFIPNVDGWYYYSQDETNTKAFAPSDTSVDDEALSKTINVWVDTNPSMYGFVSNARSGCMFSAYQKLLLNLRSYLEKYSLSTSLQYHFFNQNKQGDMYESSLSDSTLYGVDESAAKNANRMLDIMQKTSDTQPSVFFSDLESFNSKKFQEALKPIAKQLFLQGKSIRIDAYLSAYGGEIANYGSSDRNIFYGMDGKETLEGLQAAVTDTAYYHRLPRPFYVLIVGTENECESIGNLVVKAYDQLYHGVPVTTCKHSHNSADYNAHDAYRFSVKFPATLANLRKGVNNGATVGTYGSDITPDETGNENVYGFSVDQSLFFSKTIQIPFMIKPQIEGLGQSYFIQVVEPLQLSVSKITETHMQERDARNPDQYLTARGKRFIRLDLHPETTNLDGFSATYTAGTDTQLSILFSAELQLLSKGLYRLLIPVVCKPDVNRNASIAQYDVSKWNLSQVDALSAVRKLAASGKLGNNVFERTIDIEGLIRSVREAFVEAENDRTIPVGEVLLDLRIR